MNEPKAVNTPGASQITGVPENTLKYWRTKGEGPRYFKAGSKKVMYLVCDLEKWLTDQIAAAS